MSSDSRWTGGLANREWQSGNRVEQPVDTGYITRQVQFYLADCRKFSLAPTEAMCLKVVFHGSDAQKNAITAAYRQITAKAAAD